MRWWMWSIGLVIVVAIGVSLLRGKPRVVGEELVKLIESRRGPLRGAIALIDYEPDRAGVAAARALPLERGHGALGGIDIVPGDPRRWLRGEGVSFAWRTVSHEEQPLRAALSGADGSRGTGDLDYSIGMTGYYSSGVENVVEKAQAQLEAMGDEELLLAWLRADRAVMAESADAVRAVKEGFLLMAREDPGPVIVFEIGAGRRMQRVYLFAGEQRPGAVVVEMECYQQGRLVWTGVLWMDGEVEPERVRQMAVRMAEEARSN